MDDDITLEKIDILRERAGIGYERARDALLRANGDVLQALVDLERDRKSWQERFQVKGNDLIERVKQLIHEGNVRRIIVKNDDRTILEFPVTVGAVGVLLAPTLAALGAITALVTRCTVIVERAEDGGSA